MKVRKVLLRIIASVLALFFTANVLICSLSYAYLGDPLGLFKIIRVAQIVNNHYVSGVDGKSLLSGALEGLVATLDDRHTLYLGGDDFREFTESTNAAYGGIGIYLSQTDEKKPFVAGLMEGMPAEAAGLERGDIIPAVNGESVDSMKLEDISKRIRGPVGTNVTLTVSRNGEERDFDVVRKEITIKTVASRMMENKVGYIRIASFSSGTAEEFAEAYKALKEDGMTGLIVDVRNNPGGLVDQAAGVADYLLPEGSTVVTFSQRNDEDQVFTTKAAGVKIPLVVLVNENSASASEILAGDVQDLHAGVIIGTKTYGKGTVQAVYPVDDDSAVKVTIAKYKTASGREVDGTGIEPDVVVPLEANDNTDYQLQKALETIQSMQENR